MTQLTEIIDSVGDEKFKNNQSDCGIFKKDPKDYLY